MSAVRDPVVVRPPASNSLVAAVRRRRPVADELRAACLYLTWPTTLVNS